VVGQVDGPHRKDGIAGQAHQQQPLIAGRHGFSQGSGPSQAGTLTSPLPGALACLRAIESIAKARVPIRSCLMVAAIKKKAQLENQWAFKIKYNVMIKRILYH